MNKHRMSNLEATLLLVGFIAMIVVISVLTDSFHDARRVEACHKISMVYIPETNQCVIVP
jgi:uncharacterized membrane protein